MIVFRLGLSAIVNGLETLGDSFHDVSFVFVHNLLFFRFDGAKIGRKCARELHRLVFSHHNSTSSMVTFTFTLVIQMSEVYGMYSSLGSEITRISSAGLVVGLAHNLLEQGTQQ